MLSMWARICAENAIYAAECGGACTVAECGLPEGGARSSAGHDRCDDLERDVLEAWRSDGALKVCGAEVALLEHMVDQQEQILEELTGDRHGARNENEMVLGRLRRAIEAAERWEALCDLELQELEVDDGKESLDWLSCEPKGMVGVLSAGVAWVEQRFDSVVDAVARAQARMVALRLIVDGGWDATGEAVAAGMRRLCR